MVEPLVLEVRRTIRATPQRLFEAWTRPEQLRVWWGPTQIECTAAEVDLRVGGTYRLANTAPDGATVWIVGQFERIDPPVELVYTWRLDPPGDGPLERVTVRFEAAADATEVVVRHERIVDEAARRSHALGWEGCLDGLAALAQD